MHLSPANPRGLFGVDFKKPIYLHIYKGVKPNNYYIEHLKNTVNKNYPALNVEVVKSDAHYQGGQHRVIIGPIAAEELMPISRAFNSLGFENFSVYYENDQISLVTRPTSRLNKSEPKSQQNFEHSAALQSIAPRLPMKGIVMNWMNWFLRKHFNTLRVKRKVIYSRTHLIGYLNMERPK